MTVTPQHRWNASQSVEQPDGSFIPAAPLQVARRQRAELLSAIHGLESALAAPAADPGWISRCTERIRSLRATFTEHVDATEGADGLYAEMLETAPRLAHAVDVLTREHAAISVALQALAARVRDADPEDMRGWASDLLRELSRHRQRGADLVYEAYATDIGGET